MGGNPVTYVDPYGQSAIGYGLAALALLTTLNGIHNFHKSQEELQRMRESIHNAEDELNFCRANRRRCSIPYDELDEYSDAIDRTKKRYIAGLGQAGYDLSSSLSGKGNRNFQLPKEPPFCDE